MADEGIDWAEVGEAVLTAALTYGLNAALNPQKNQSVSTDIPRQAPLSPVINSVGSYSRRAGALMFKEVKGSVLDMVLAYGDGWHEVEYVYLGDDRIDSYTAGDYVLTTSRGGEPNTDGRYEDERVQIRWNVGLPTETAFAEIITDFPDLWTVDHRGDGTGTLMVRNIAPKAKFFPQAFPTGATETVAVSAREFCYDWRDPAQDREDISTWGPCANPIVWLVHLEWTKWEMDWDTQIAPVLDALTDAADICDHQIGLDGGGTEPRYTVAFNYPDDEDERTVRGKLLAAMDGFYTLDGLNRLVVKAGVYEAPTVTLTFDPPYGEILSYSWVAGVSPDQAVSEINISFTDPATDYNPGDCDPWIVSDYGRPDDLDLPQVFSWTQARRLAKRRAARVMPRRTGSFVTDLRGMVAWSERYIQLVNPYEPSMDGVAVEIIDAPELDIMAGTVSFSVIEIDPGIDAWNPATEEGEPPVIAARPVAELLADPVIVDAQAMFVDTTSARISIEATGPSRTDITWSGRWRIVGATSWTEFTDTSLTGGSVTMTTGTVPVNSNIEVEVSYRTAGGSSSDWSATVTESTSTSTIAPGPVTSPSATGGSGKVDLAWINPVSTNYNRVVIRRATNSGMTTGLTTVATLYGSAGQAMTYSDTGLSAGAYHYTITAYNSGSAASTTPSPQPLSATAS